MIILILKTIFTFLAVYWTITNTGRLIMKNDIPTANLVFQTIGITGLIVMFYYI